MSYTSMLIDYTIEELFEQCALYGIVEETEEPTDFTSDQLVQWLREYHEEQSAQDHMASFYAY